MLTVTLGKPLGTRSFKKGKQAFFEQDARAKMASETTVARLLFVPASRPASRYSFLALPVPPFLSSCEFHTATLCSSPQLV